MFFISTVYIMPNYFPTEIKDLWSGVKSGVYPCAWKMVLSVPFSRGHDFNYFFFTCLVEKTDIEKQGVTLCDSEGVRNNNNQHFLGWENSSLP